MTATSNLRAQASEFLALDEQSTASATNTTVPTRNSTPVPTSAPRAASTAASEASSEDTASTGTAGHDVARKVTPASDDKTAARVAAHNRGSFSTLNEATAADTESYGSDVPALSNTESDDQAGSAASSDTAAAKKLRQRIKNDGKLPSSAPATVYHERLAEGNMPTKEYQIPYQTLGGNYLANYDYGNTAVYPNNVIPTYAPQAMYGGYYMPANTAVNMTATDSNVVNPQVQTMLSTGADPISEGRRVYIGNLKYTVNRGQVKKLLRQYGVYQTVEKIYMPYSDTPLESSSGPHGPEHGGSDHFHHQHHDEHDDHQQGEDGNDLPNKGYVFVTYGDAAEASLAMERISGIVHMERRLVCRPGLPKGTTFSGNIGGPDHGNRSGFHGGKKRNYRRDNAFDSNDHVGGGRQRQHYGHYNNSYQPQQIAGGDDFQHRPTGGGHRRYDTVTQGYANVSAGPHAGATFYTAHPTAIANPAYNYNDGAVYYNGAAPYVAGPAALGGAKGRYSADSGYRSTAPNNNNKVGGWLGQGAGYNHHRRGADNGGYRLNR